MVTLACYNEHACFLQSSYDRQSITILLYILYRTCIQFYCCVFEVFFFSLRSDVTVRHNNNIRVHPVRVVLRSCSAHALVKRFIVFFFFIFLIFSCSRKAPTKFRQPKRVNVQISLPRRRSYYERACIIILIYIIIIVIRTRTKNRSRA